MPNVTIVVPQPATQSTSPLPTGSASPSPSSENDAQNATTSPGSIVGGVIGGLAFLSIAVVGGFLLLRRRRHKKLPDREGSMDMVEQQEGLTPFILFPREPPVLIIERSSEADSSKSLAPLQPDDSAAGSSSHEPTLTADSPTPKRPLPERPGGLPGAAPSPESNQSLSAVPLSSGSRFGRSPTGEMMLLPRADVLNMQAEMEELREEMRQIIEERLEPPPEYTSTFGS